MRHQLARLGSYALAPARRARLAPGARFVVYCPPRTGSTMLVSLLDSHPAVRCEGELLASGAPRPAQLFDGRAVAARLAGHRAWGCKVITLHTRWYAERYGPPRALIERLVGHGYHLIVLRRRNWLLQALSILHAQRHRYHYTRRDRVAFEPMHVDPVEVLSALLVVEQEVDLLDEVVHDLPHLALTYEEHLGDPVRQQRTVDRIAGWLGLPQAPVRTEQVAIAPPSAEGRVANLEEVAELVARTRFAAFLPSHQLGATVVPYGDVEGVAGAAATSAGAATEPGSVATAS